MIYALIVMSAVVIAQLIERYYYTREMNARFDDCIKAAMSRDVTEYVQAKAVEKIVAEPFKEPDEVELRDSDDATFDKYIKNQVK